MLYEHDELKRSLKKGIIDELRSVEVNCLDGSYSKSFQQQSAYVTLLLLSVNFFKADGKDHRNQLARFIYQSKAQT